MTWKKYPAEDITVPADWNDLIASDDDVDGDVTVAINGTSAGLTVTIPVTTDKVSKVRLVGGTAKTRVNLVFTVHTVNGSTFTPIKTLVMLSPNDPSWA